MNLDHVILAAEDRLSEAVATKILMNMGFKIVRKPQKPRNSRLKGNSYLKKRAPEFNRSATGPYYFFMLTDLDSPKICPPELIQSWINAPLNPRFFLRVAVMEVESWVMADQSAFAEFLRVPIQEVPTRTDEIPDPKALLLSLAQKSKSWRLRKDMLPKNGNKTSKIGPGYNNRLCGFVRDYWDMNRAVSVSPSLKRTVDRLQSTKPILGTDQ